MQARSLKLPAASPPAILIGGTFGGNAFAVSVQMINNRDKINFNIRVFCFYKAMLLMHGSIGRLFLLVKGDLGIKKQVLRSKP